MEIEPPRDADEKAVGQRRALAYQKGMFADHGLELVVALDHPRGAELTQRCLQLRIRFRHLHRGGKGPVKPVLTKPINGCIRSASGESGAKLMRRSLSRASSQTAIAIVSVNTRPASVIKTGVSCRALMRA